MHTNRCSSVSLFFCFCSRKTCFKKKTRSWNRNRETEQKRYQTGACKNTFSGVIYNTWPDRCLRCWWKNMFFITSKNVRPSSCQKYLLKMPPNFDPFRIPTLPQNLCLLTFNSLHFTALILKSIPGHTPTPCDWPEDITVNFSWPFFFHFFKKDQTFFFIGLRRIKLKFEIHLVQDFPSLLV